MTAATTAAAAPVEPVVAFVDLLDRVAPAPVAAARESAASRRRARADPAAQPGLQMARAALIMVFILSFTMFLQLR